MIQKLVTKSALFIGGIIFGGVAVPVVGRALRPLVKGVVREGIRVKENTASLFENAKEELDDIVAEAKEDLDLPVEEEHDHDHDHDHDHKH